MPVGRCRTAVIRVIGCAGSRWERSIVSGVRGVRPVGTPAETLTTISGSSGQSATRGIAQSRWAHQHMVGVLRC